MPAIGACENGCGVRIAFEVLGSVEATGGGVEVGHHPLAVVGAVEPGAHSATGAIHARLDHRVSPAECGRHPLLKQEILRILPTFPVGEAIQPAIGQFQQFLARADLYDSQTIGSRVVLHEHHRLSCDPVLGVLTSDVPEAFVHLGRQFDEAGLPLEAFVLGDDPVRSQQPWVDADDLGGLVDERLGGAEVG